MIWTPTPTPPPAPGAPSPLVDLAGLELAALVVGALLGVAAVVWVWRHTSRDDARLTITWEKFRRDPPERR